MPSNMLYKVLAMIAQSNNLCSFSDVLCLLAVTMEGVL